MPQKPGRVSGGGFASTGIRAGTGILPPFQTDARGIKRRGIPPGIYLPADPGRRKRLLQALGYLPPDSEEYEEAS